MRSGTTGALGDERRSTVARMAALFSCSIMPWYLKTVSVLFLKAISFFEEVDGWWEATGRGEFETVFGGKKRARLAKGLMSPTARNIASQSLRA